MARRRWPEATKVAAMADLAAGMTLREVMEKYDMPRSTASALSPTSQRGSVKVHKIVELNEMGELYRTQLGHNFRALTALTDVIQNDTKYAIEHGQELAILYGVLFDKTGKLAGAALAGSGVDQPVSGHDDPTPRATLRDDAPDTQDTP